MQFVRCARLKVKPGKERIPPIVSERRAGCPGALEIDHLACAGHFIKKVHSLDPQLDLLGDIEENRSVKLTGTLGERKAILLPAPLVPLPDDADETIK